MVSMKPTNLQPVCEVSGCKQGAQLLSLTGTTATWMQTCKIHNYQNLEEEQGKIETFWPPDNY